MLIQMIKNVFLVGLIIILLSCSNENKVHINYGGIGALSDLPGVIGIKILGKDKQLCYAIIGGSINAVSSLPESLKESHAGILINKDLNRYPHPDFEYRGPYLKSPAGSMIVASLVNNDAHYMQPYHFTVIDLISGNISRVVQLGDERVVKGIAWSYDSEYFAILSSNTRSSFGLANIFSAMSGHPVKKTDYFLDIFDKHSTHVTTVNVIDGLESGGVDITWVKKKAIDGVRLD